MKTTTNPAASATRNKFLVLGVLLVAAFAVAFIALYALARLQQAPSPTASAVPSRMDAAARNQRLFELNEGNMPAAPIVRVDRNKRLLELNEGNIPAAARSPRDQRLYELNR